MRGMEISFCPQKEKNILFNFISSIPFSTIDLLYKASTQGFDAKNFQESCSNQEKLMVLIKANGFVFGGYNNESWTKNNADDKWKCTKESFIFSLSNPENKPSKFKKHSKFTTNFTFYSSQSLLFFGEDIHIKAGCDVNEESYSDLGDTFRGLKNNNFFFFFFCFF